MIYKKNLRELRTSEDLTQASLGKLINVDRKVYNNFETEYTIMPMKHLNTLCNYFNVSIDYIFDLNKEKKYEDFRNDINPILSGQRLKNWRKENKITQESLSDLLNADRSILSKYEQGKYVISTGFLYTICKKYKISADYLLGKTDEPKYLG